MNEHDVIKQMKRFPNGINPSKRMVSKTWKCSICNKVHLFKTEHTIPSPCSCGSIYFEVLKNQKCGDCEWFDSDHCDTNDEDSEICGDFWIDNE